MEKVLRKYLFVALGLFVFATLIYNVTVFFSLQTLLKNELINNEIASRFLDFEMYDTIIFLFFSVLLVFIIAVYLSKKFAEKIIKKSVDNVNLLDFSNENLEGIIEIYPELKGLIDDSIILKTHFMYLESKVAHEIKTPLSIISNRLFKLKMGKLDPEAREEIEKCESTISYLKRVIERIIKVTQVSNNEYQLEIDHIGKTNFIDRVYEHFGHYQSKFPDVVASLTVDLKDRHKIQTDFYIFGNIYLSLLDNAFKYCDKKVDINIYELVEEKDGEKIQKVVISIENDGRQIPESDYDEIFKLFNSHREKSKTSTGIGLSIVKQCVDLIHGKISVSSRNGMTKFVVTVPDLSSAI